MISVVEKYLSIFFIYSFLGWAMETIGGYFKTKKLVNRGFLIGPYCPVYGIGVSLLTVFLSKYTDDIPIMFFMSILICGTLEYFTSYIMEKIFKARWWDYHNRRFNINGRICLETLIPFGIVGVVLVKYTNPFFLNILSTVKYLRVILIVISIIFIIDFIFSLKTILGFRKEAVKVEKEVKDDTEEINAKIKEIASEKVSEIGEVTSKKIKEIKDSTNIRVTNAKQSFQKFNHRLIASYKIMKRNVKFTGQKLYDNLVTSTENLKQKFTLKRDLNKVDSTKLVKERISKKSWLNRRLVDAFPNLEIKLKKDKHKK